MRSQLILFGACVDFSLNGARVYVRDSVEIERFRAGSGGVRMRSISMVLLKTYVATYALQRSGGINILLLCNRRVSSAVFLCNLTEMLKRACMGSKKETNKVCTGLAS